MMQSERRLAAGVAAAFVCLLLTHVLMLPPFEGFDETAHYSYVSLLADRGEIPDLRTTPLDATVDRDRAGLPRPYAGTPPFDDVGGPTYATFHDPANAAAARAAAARFWTAGEPAAYAAGDGPNWQGQHPPLFYALMSVPYRFAATAAPGVRLLTMRLAAVALAAGSVGFWWLTLRRLQEPAARRLWLGAGAATLLLPACWQDLARLGNDSLTALLTSATIYAAVRAEQTRRIRDDALLGAVLGLGLLTKALFVPVTAGLLAYRALGLLRRERRAVLGVAVLAIVPLLVSGWWFAVYAERYGSPLGSHETDALPRNGPVDLTPLAAAKAVGRGAAAFGATFLWSGSWSWVQRPRVWYALMAPLLLAAAATAPKTLRERGECRSLVGLAAAMLGLVLAAFAYLMFLRIRYTGVGSGVGGYYLFVAWPLVGLGFAGTWSLAAGPCGRAVLWVAVVAALAFEASGLWFSAQVYAGLVGKIGTDKVGTGGVWPTPANLRLVADRLGLLAFPATAVVFYAASLAVRAAVFRGLARLVREGELNREGEAPAEPQATPDARRELRDRGSAGASPSPAEPRS